VDLNNGLVAYYPFNGNANDESGNGNNAVFNNATLTSDNLGNANSAYHFNGTDTYMRILNSTSLNMGNQMSIALHVKPMGFYTGFCYNNMMIMKGDADYLTGDYFLRFSDAITGCTNPSTTNEQFYAPDVIAAKPIVQLDNWYDVVWTFDGTTAKIYVGCKLQSSAAATYSTFTNAYDLYIGKLNDPTFPYWLNGDLDEVRIYNRALNEQEVNALCLLSALPITFAKFETNVIDKQIKLNWYIENENSIRNYIIERSITGISNFLPIGTVPAKNIHTYVFRDSTAERNKNYYYRLAALGYDNTLSFSEIKSAKINAKNKLTIISPNPSKGTVIVKIQGYTGKANFTIINPVGQIVMKKNEMVSNNPIPLNLAKHSRGIYTLKIETSEEVLIERIMIL
jgi:hypothetical protein